MGMSAGHAATPLMSTGVGVLDKAMALVAEVEMGAGASLRELQERTGLSKTTAYRLLCSLESHGLLQKDGEGSFRLGSRFGASSLIQVATPVLRRLAAQTGESTQLFVRRGEMRLALVSIESEQELRASVPVGSLGALQAGGNGSLLLEEPVAVRRGWSHYVDKNIAYISAPILDEAGAVSAAVCLSGPVDRLDHDVIERLTPRVVAAASDIQAVTRP